MTGGVKTNCTSLVKKDHDEKTDQTADFSTASVISGQTVPGQNPLLSAIVQKRTLIEGCRMSGPACNRLRNVG
jgi:hypothetical protein